MHRILLALLQCCAWVVCTAACSYELNSNTIGMIRKPDAAIAATDNSIRTPGQTKIDAEMQTTSVDDCGDFYPEEVESCVVLGRAVSIAEIPNPNDDCLTCLCCREHDYVVDCFADNARGCAVTDAYVRGDCAAQCMR